MGSSSSKTNTTNTNYTIDDVKNYIKSLLPIIKELKAKAPINIQKLIEVFNTNFDENIQKTIFYREKIVELNDFSKKDENNPFSFIASMYMLNKLKFSNSQPQTKPKATTEQLSKVHDGWSICRLMNLNPDGTFSFDYKTN